MAREACCVLRLVDGFAVDEPAGPQPPVTACALLVAVGANGVGVFCLRPALAAAPGIVWDRARSTRLEHPLEKRSLADGLHRDHAGGPNCSRMAALLGGIRAHPCCDSRTRRQIGPAIDASMITANGGPETAALCINRLYRSGESWETETLAQGPERHRAAALLPLPTRLLSVRAILDTCVCPSWTKFSSAGIKIGRDGVECACS